MFRHICSDQALRKAICKQEAAYFRSLYFFRNQRIRYKEYSWGFLSRSKCFPTRVKNYCSLTGKGRSVYSQFRLSRSVLREHLIKGRFFGVRKASW